LGKLSSLRSAGLVLFVILLAVMFGEIIAREHWIYLVVLPAAIIALQWPLEVALGLYVFLVPFGAVSALGSSSSGTTLNWAVGALAGMGLLVAGVVRKRLSFPPREVQLWSAFFIWAVVTVAWASEPAASTKLLPTAAALVALYAFAASWRVTNRQLILLCCLAVAGGFLASIAILYLYSSGVTYGTWTQTSRASLIVADRETNPNGIAAELLLPLSLAVGWFISARNWSGKVTAFVMFGIMSYAAFLTMSRAFIVSLAVVFCIYIWRLGLNRRLIILTTAILAVTISQPSMFFLRLKEALATHGAGRLDIWRAGFAVLKAYWLSGAGLNNFPVVYQDYAGYAPVFSGYNRGSHNMYLNVVVELGIVGLVLMLATLFYHFRAVAKVRSALSGSSPILVTSLEGACWAMLANAFFGDILWTKPFWVCWLLLAMMLRLGRDSSNSAQVATVPAPTAEFAVRYEPWRVS
jgi:hypothetical protein